jgi:hypothetical protein
LNDVEKLLAIEEIKKLKARYFRAIDTKHWELLRSCFADDVVFDAGDGGGVRLGTGDSVKRGADLLTRFISETVAAPVAIHHGHMPEIEILSATTAEGIWALEDRFFWPEGSPRRTMQGFGYYHETYEKIEGSWRLKTMKNVRLRVDVT